MPVFCRSVSPLTTRRIGIEGAINIPVSICGVVVNPGDLVVGDDDGIFVVSPELAEEYREKAIAKQNGEPALKKRIDNGERLSDINGCNKYFGICNMPIATSTYWNEVHGSKQEDVEKDKEGLQTMRNLARNMTFLIKAIQLGKEKYGLPEIERKYFTNFTDGL